MLLVGACSDSRSAADRAQIRASLNPGDAVRGMVLLHASARGRRLLWGIPTAQLPREVTAQPSYHLRMGNRHGLHGAPLDGDPPVLDAVLSPDGARAAAVLVGGSLQVTGMPGGAQIPMAAPGLAFSPGGDQLAFVCGQAPETDLCAVDVATGRWRKLAAGPGPQDRPSFARDGEVLFVSAVDGMAAIWSVGLQPGARTVQWTKQGQSPRQSAGPAHVPVPVGPRGALAVGQDLLLDTGEALIAVGPGGTRTLAPTGSLLLGSQGRRVLVLRPTADGWQLWEVTP